MKKNIENVNENVVENIVNDDSVVVMDQETMQAQ